jgi:polysaccharide export outer membrane protein
MARLNIAEWLGLFVMAACLVCSMAMAETVDPKDMYRAQPGDVLQIGVWKEPDLSMEVLVRPDGGFSLPLIGEVNAGGKTILELREELFARLGKYVPDTDVFVGVRQLNGNKIYIIGKVARPGEFVVLRPTDVMQALSMAGGPTPFADVNDIRVLRRTEEGQLLFPFRYGDIEKGVGVEQNIVLRSGDVVIVP